MVAGGWTGTTGVARGARMTGSANASWTGPRVITSTPSCAAGTAALAAGGAPLAAGAGCWFKGTNGRSCPYRGIVSIRAPQPTPRIDDSLTNIVIVLR